jgi:putative transposase
VKANQAELPVRAMCKTLRVSHSGFYEWLDRPACARAQANVMLLDQIRQAHVASDATYGVPRVQAELADMGVTAGHNRIAALMRANGLRGVSRRRAWCVTTKRDKEQRPAADLVQRQFTATRINQLWVADMTYIPTWAGFVYLAVVLDVFSRKVVGWAFGQQQTADLVIAALNMALITRKPQDVIHHSDQGSQPGFNWSSQHRYGSARLNARWRRIRGFGCGQNSFYCIQAPARPPEAPQLRPVLRFQPQLQDGQRRKCCVIAHVQR